MIATRLCWTAFGTSAVEAVDISLRKSPHVIGQFNDAIMLVHYTRCMRLRILGVWKCGIEGESRPHLKPGTFLKCDSARARLFRDRRHVAMLFKHATINP